MLSIMLWLDVPAVARKKRVSALTHRLIDQLLRDPKRRTQGVQFHFEIEDDRFDVDMLNVLQLDALRRHKWTRRSYSGLDEEDEGINGEYSTHQGLIGSNIEAHKDGTETTVNAKANGQTRKAFDIETELKQQKALTEIRDAMVSLCNNRYPHLSRSAAALDWHSPEFVKVFIQIKSALNEQDMDHFEVQELKLLSVLRKHVEHIVWALAREGVITESPLQWNVRLAEEEGLGLKWEPIPQIGPLNEVPNRGKEISNFRLSVALGSKTQFTREEWEAFGIKDLRGDDYIKVHGVYYFTPAEIDWNLSDNEKKERKLIQRLGFLLSNYTCQSWYWVTAPPLPFPTSISF